MRVYLNGLGCKLNESELEAWARQFAAEGYEIVDDDRSADICVVNTCTVTHVAARKSRSLVNRIAHANENARILLTGCYATMSREEAKNLPNVARVVSNSEKDQLVALAGRLSDDPAFQMSANGCRMPEATSGEFFSDAFIQPSLTKSAEMRPLDIHTKHADLSFSSLKKGGGRGVHHPRTRAFVKIEDGCNLSCTYCIIPLARGKARSRPQRDVVAEVARLAGEGYQEVVLTGVQISDYRLEERVAERGRLRGLCSLVSGILDNTLIQRLRLTSIAPWDLDDELLGLFANPRLCKHLHLSLQSGSTSVLRRMRRPYTSEQYADAVDRVRSLVPEAGITTDVIVGFPGESDDEFLESLEFVEKMGFARVHVFPYSARAGTHAAELPHHVPESLKGSRATAMQRIAESSAERYASRFLGRTLPVLYEAKADVPETWSGYTGNYIRILARGDENLTNRILPTRIDRIGGGIAWGTLDLVPVHP
jgi:threonylcarbamoyladenosine tRNA methylthiotransferase MtaB